jgi:hypothetical protein
MHLNDFCDMGQERRRAQAHFSCRCCEVSGEQYPGRIFDSGLAISLFRISRPHPVQLASACNLLGLAVDWMRAVSGRHGETVRETATMVSFMADVIGIRDDMYIGKGHTYMLEVAEAAKQGFSGRH